LFLAVFKRTFYRQFTAGQTHDEVEQMIQKYQNMGISVILNDCVEDAVTKQQMENNKNVILNVLNTAKDVPFVPIKLTSITAPALLEKMTDIIRQNEKDKSIELPWVQVKDNKSKKMNTVIRTTAKFDEKDVLELNELLGRFDAIGECAKKK